MTEDTEKTAGEVAETVLAWIDSGRYHVGQRIPSEQLLAAQFSTSRARIRTALAMLARRGVLAPRAKKGWIVEVGLQAQRVGELRSFSQWAHDHGREHGGRIVQREASAATAWEAGSLGVPLGAEVVRFTRVRFLDRHPMMIERSSWAPFVRAVIEQLPDDTPSVFAALEASGIPVALGDHRIEAVAASSEDARLLCLRRSSPMLQVTRTTLAVGGIVVEAAVDRYVTDTVAFDVRAQDTTRALLAPRRRQ